MRFTFSYAPPDKAAVQEMAAALVNDGRTVSIPTAEGRRSTPNRLTHDTCALVIITQAYLDLPEGLRVWSSLSEQIKAPNQRRVFPVMIDGTWAAGVLGKITPIDLSTRVSPLRERHLVKVLAGLFGDPPPPRPRVALPGSSSPAA